MADLPEYSLFAIRYATRDAKRSAHFIGGDPHDAPMPMDYFIWVAISGDQSVVIDTGFNAEIAANRSREFLRCPAEALKLVGVDREKVQNVVLTHLHYDHVGNFDQFPNARFHLQQAELNYATGRHMRFAHLARSFEVDEIVGVVRLNFARRLHLLAGQAEIAPGIILHPVPGHTAGMQCVRVHTARGWVVVASDATHYYENMDREEPHSSVFHVGDALEAFDTLRALAPTPDHIIPGHDPRVLERYPAPSASLEGIVACLDVPPHY